MANSNNARNNKKEHFNLIEDIMNDKMKLAIVIAIIVLTGVAIYLYLNQHPQSGAGFMNSLSLSDTSPMAPLTNTPSM